MVARFVEHRKERSALSPTVLIAFPVHEDELASCAARRNTELAKQSYDGSAKLRWVTLILFLFAMGGN